MWVLSEPQAPRNPPRMYWWREGKSFWHSEFFRRLSGGRKIPKTHSVSFAQASTASKWWRAFLRLKHADTTPSRTLWRSLRPLK
jgi:hypothetical protein